MRSEKRDWPEILFLSVPTKRSPRLKQAVLLLLGVHSSSSQTIRDPLNVLPVMPPLFLEDFVFVVLPKSCHQQLLFPLMGKIQLGSTLHRKLKRCLVWIFTFLSQPFSAKANVKCPNKFWTRQRIFEPQGRRKKLSKFTYILTKQWRSPCNLTNYFDGKNFQFVISLDI